jgi:GH24 family phage-related lysozyme (muramidase)
MKTSLQGLKLIERFEGLSLTPYQDCVGLWTIGIGHLIGKTLLDNRTLTINECYALLASDVKKFELGVARYITAKLTQNQFDALISFAFNLGLGTLQRSSLRQKLNRGDIQGCLQTWAKYNKAGGKVVKGLDLRRKAEIELFKG